ncbi:ribonuclease H-like domain-containing protein [Tanacetum coccineum]
MCGQKERRFCLLLTLNVFVLESPCFKLPNENQILLKVPGQNNMYSFYLENIVPLGGLACLIAKATTDESNKWHMRDVIEFCGLKGIKREYSNARTPQQNGVAERKNRTLIEAARTMLTDSFLPNIFWAEAVSTACYVLNRVLVTKPHNKTPYELLTGKTPSYIRPFGCHVTILNTIDHLGKFAGKSDEGFLVGSENQANIHAGQQESNQNTGTKDKIDAGDSEKEDESAQDCFELPIWHSYSSTNTSASKSDNKRGGPREEEQAEGAKSSSTNIFSTVSTTAKASGTNLVNTVSIPVSTASPNEGLSLFDTTNFQEDDSEIPPLEDIHQDTTDGIFTHSSYDDVGIGLTFTTVSKFVKSASAPLSLLCQALKAHSSMY